MYTNFLLLLLPQIVSDDIEVIEETIPKLEAFYTSYNEISSEVDDLLKKMETFSVSAISSDGLESKNRQLQELEEAVNERRSKLEALLASCDLLETPFDQTQFEKNVSELQEKMAQCDQVTYREELTGHIISTLFVSMCFRLLLGRRLILRHWEGKFIQWRTCSVSLKPGLRAQMILSTNSVQLPLSSQRENSSCRKLR